MSYILDALRKSEAERARGEAPSLLTTTDPHRIVPRYVVWLLIAILCVNAVLLALWLVPFPLPESADAPSPVTITQSTSDAKPSEVPDLPVASAGPAPDTRFVQGPAAAAAPSPIASPTPSTIPRLDISTHVYSEYPDLRAVTVNGRRYSEGDEILPGMWLVEITEGGIVIEYGGERSEVDVLDSWR